MSAKTTKAERGKFFTLGSKKEDSREAIIEKLPSAYYDFVDLFLRRATKELLPHRPGLDYKIKLLPGT